MDMPAHSAVWMALLLLAGCASAPPEQDLGRLGLQPEVPDVDISRFQAPENAGAFRLQGQLEVPDQDQVVFRYALPGAPDRRLDISVYPLPPGWHDLSAERIVSGHYGQVRQAFADRATHSHGKVVLRAMQEQLRRDVAGTHTVAEGVLLEESGASARLIVLEIATLPNVFVRVTASAPEAAGQEQLEDARIALTRFLEQQSGHAASTEQPTEQGR